MEIITSSKGQHIYLHKTEFLFSVSRLRACSQCKKEPDAVLNKWLVPPCGNLQEAITQPVSWTRCRGKYVKYEDFGKVPFSLQSVQQTEHITFLKSTFFINKKKTHAWLCQSLSFLITKFKHTDRLRCLWKIKIPMEDKVNKRYVGDRP